MAIKIMNRAKIRDKGSSEERIVEEIKSQYVLSITHPHHNIVKLMEHWHDDQDVFIATEYCNFGDLKKFLFQRKTLSEEEVRVLIKDVVDGKWQH